MIRLRVMRKIQMLIIPCLLIIGIKGSNKVKLNTIPGVDEVKNSETSTNPLVRNYVNHI